jgi:hypothetical protein
MYWEKTCPSATLSTTNLTWPDPGANPGRRGGKPATNRLSYGAATLWVFTACYRDSFTFTFTFTLPLYLYIYLFVAFI